MVKLPFKLLKSPEDVMSITGNLTELYLCEIFRLISLRNHSGLLTIWTELEAGSQNTQHIWFESGRIVTVESPNQLSLQSMMIQRQWLSQDALEAFKSCPDNIPVGLWLANKNILQVDQLKLLFHAQVIRPVCAMFKLKNSKFELKIQPQFPNTEMTGLSISAQEANLLGLRVLRDWNHLSLKLPHSMSVLSKLSKTPVQLDPLEWQIWEFADGQTPLEIIAEELFQPIEMIQKAAFRLMLVNRVKEISPLVSPTRAIYQNSIC